MEKNHNLSLILSELGHSVNYDRIAKRFGISSSKVRDLDVEHNQRFVVSDDGQGRKELRKHIVYVKHVDALWPRKNEAIEKAKRDYDAGLVDVCTGRDGFNLILYAIPRTTRAKRRHEPYFSSAQRMVA